MRSFLKVFYLVFSVLALISCGEKQEQTKPDMTSNQTTKSDMHEVTIKEKVNASNYSYLNVTEDDKSFWIAVPQMEVKPGDIIVYSKFMEMKNFKSETLNKTFESVLFVDDARSKNNSDQMKSPHSGVASQKDESIKIEPVNGGYSIANVYTQKKSLADKIIKVKGKVVKVNENIMGVNWIHIQDGTGADESHDLLVTSESKAKVGDIIVAEGQLKTDVDFGSGYAYSVLLENSKIAVQ